MSPNIRLSISPGLVFCVLFSLSAHVTLCCLFRPNLHVYTFKSPVEVVKAADINEVNCPVTEYS